MGVLFLDCVEIVKILPRKKYHYLASLATGLDAVVLQKNISSYAACINSKYIKCL